MINLTIINSMSLCMWIYFTIIAQQSGIKLILPPQSYNSFPGKEIVKHYQIKLLICFLEQKSVWELRFPNIS